MATSACPLCRVPRLHEFDRDNSLMDDYLRFRRQTAPPEPGEGNAKQQFELGRGNIHGNDRLFVEDWLSST